MVPHIRTVKTSSGARAVQIVYSNRGGKRTMEHIGSAHDDAELDLNRADLPKSHTRVDGARKVEWKTPPTGPYTLAGDNISRTTVIKADRLGGRKHPQPVPTRWQATTVAERVGWSGSIRWFRDNVNRVRADRRRIDPADRLSWKAGDAAQCDLWFPPRKILLEEMRSLAVHARQAMLGVLAASVSIAAALLSVAAILTVV